MTTGPGSIRFWRGQLSELTVDMIVYFCDKNNYWKPDGTVDLVLPLSHGPVLPHVAAWAKKKNVNLIHDDRALQGPTVPII